MKEHRVLRFTAVVGACTGLSRTLGFVREVLMAAFFGTSLAQSAFVVAFKIPNLFRRLFGEGALSAALVPVFTDALEKEGKDRAWALAGRIFTLLGLLLACIALLAIVVITGVLNHGGLGEKAALVMSLLRITLPYMFFICLAAVCMAILNSFHHFFIPAITPAVLNIVWILVLLFICPRFGSEPVERIYGVAWGILFAGAVQLCMQIPFLLRHGFRGPLVSDLLRDERVGRILRLAGPAAVGMGITQVNVMVDTLLAMWVGAWAPAALSFAERLIYLPLGVFATALGTVLLPVLSRQASRAGPDQIRATVSESLRSLLFVMIPAAAGLFVLAQPIIALVYQRGAFDEWSTTLTARALMFYAPGLVVFGSYKAIVPAFYAMKDTVTPVRVGLFSMFLNLALNITFILTWPTYFKHAGLALATVLAGTVNLVVLGVLLQRRIGSPGWGRIFRGGAAALAAAIVMAVVALSLHGWVSRWLGGAGIGATAVQVAALAASVGGGLGVYVALLAPFGCLPRLRGRSAGRPR